MKIRLEMDESVSEEEIIIRCKELTDEVVTLQKRIAEIGKTQMQLHVTKGDSAYFLELDEILFLESSGATVAVHTANHMYETKQRLYELEEILPAGFMRISKSTIINTGKIRSIKKNITGASEVEFIASAKKTFVSRSYFKTLMSKLEEKRLKK